FCAFRLLGLGRYQGAMDPFLDDAAALIDDPKRISDEELERLENDFIQAMMLAVRIFGSRAFRKSPSSPLNRPMFESLAVTLAEVAGLGAELDIIRISAEIRALVYEDREYYEAISSSTGGRTKVMYRFGKARELVLGR